MTCCERSEDPHRARVSGCQLSRPRPLKPLRPHHQRQARQLASAFVRRQTPLICLSPARLSVDLFDAGCRVLLWLVDVSAILRSASILIRSEEKTPTPSSATQEPKLWSLGNPSTGGQTSHRTRTHVPPLLCSSQRIRPDRHRTPEMAAPRTRVPSRGQPDFVPLSTGRSQRTALQRQSQPPSHSMVTTLLTTRSRGCQTRQAG